MGRWHYIRTSMGLRSEPSHTQWYVGLLGDGVIGGQISVPKEFKEMSERIVQTVKENMDGNEVRALAADSVGCPVLVVGVRANSTSRCR